MVIVYKVQILGMMKLFTDRFPEAVGLFVEHLLRAEFEQAGDPTPALVAVAFHPDVIHAVQEEFLNLNTLSGKSSALNAIDKILKYKIVKMFFQLVEQHRQLKPVDRYFR